MSEALPLDTATAPSPAESLHRDFGLAAFRPGQEEIIASVLAGRDTLAIMPTGGGKSLCYQLPAVVRRQLVIVVCPLVSLMQDQVAALRRLGIPAGCLHHGQPVADKRAVFQAVAAGGPYVLYLSPERVQKPGFADWVRKQAVAAFAVDEAHCVSQWGPDFRPDYFRLERLRDLRPDVPLLALSATATPQVIGDIAERLGMQDPSRHVHGFYRPNLYYQVQDCRNDAAKLDILEQALQQVPGGKVVVYCGTRRTCEELATTLGPRHAGVDHYHAGLEAEERQRVQQAFSAGDVRILCATVAFGMGVDEPDIRLVVHYQLPGNIESYYQEVGRAGRDGAPAACLLLYAKKDKGLQSYFIRNAEAPQAVLNHRWQALDTMVQYAEGSECRHAEILTYFQDAKRITACGHCDVCAPEAPQAIRIAHRSQRVPNTGPRRKSAPVKEAPLGPEEQRRLEALRAWRKDHARSLDRPAFTLFSDRTLRELARQAPQDAEALRQVYGLGNAKVEQFGSEVLAVLRSV